MSVQGIDGSFCSPACDSSGSCPSDVPSGVTAQPTCALKDQSGNQECALICSPSLPIRDQKAADAQCGSNASCKSIQGTGICTYDDGSSHQVVKTLTTLSKRVSNTDACSETTQSACDAASGCTWCKCAALPSKCWTKEDAAKLPAGVYVCDSSKPTFLRGAKIATA